MSAPRRNRAFLRAFDIRNVIGALLAIYAVLLIITGLAPGLLPPHSDPGAASNRTDLYVGTDANWWVGLAMLAVAVFFFLWAWLRPVTSPESDAAQPDSD